MNPQPQRNILLITTDQQRFDTIHAAGNPHILTPHLDWLFDDGIYFSNAYSDCPVCMPARATIMTGRYAYSHGLTGNRGDVRPMEPATTLPGVLTRAGYQTCAIGKMHFHPLRCHYGFERMEILEHYYRDMARHPERGRPMEHGLGQNEMEPVISTVHENHSLTHWTIERSIDFLETRDDTRPFFLWTSIAKPHPPFDPCRNYWDLYETDALPLPIRGDWSARWEDVPPGYLAATFDLNMAHRFDDRRWRAIRRAYYACITQLDYALGLLFARLRELGLFENTLILFTSDHGEMLGDHHMGAKSVPFEGSSHIPLLARLPHGSWDRNAVRGLRCGALTALADIYPTCLAFAGATPPPDVRLDGLDLLAAARGEAERERLIGECGPYHFVREGRWKYCYEARGGAQLLFDLESDPLEQHDLIRAGAAVEVAHRLREALIARLAASGSDLVREGRLVPKEPGLRAQDLMAHPWPGFHSSGVPSDVLH